jgi:hypothetical protein
MLRNPIYRGQIVHKDQHYPGEHEPIIDQPLWEEVQSKLAANAVERTTGERMLSPSLLAGLLYDGQGHRMTPSHAVKKGMRYRYYVSQPLISKTRETAPEGLRLAAAEIERIVLSGIGEWMSGCNNTGRQRKHLEMTFEEGKVNTMIWTLSCQLTNKASCEGPSWPSFLLSSNQRTTKGVSENGAER